MLGKAICWLLRRHKFRKVREYELGLFGCSPEGKAKVCARCGLVREVKRRAKNG